MAQPGKKSKNYEKFVAKFERKLTTDDCYTPPLVYAAVLRWCREKYAIPEDAPILRPFYPGGDYERADYPAGCYVIDNPPFSIVSKIVQWYAERNIRFFLFAPYLTNLNIRNCNHVITPYSVTYENGAKVDTSFVTNLGDDFIASEPDLYRLIKAADEATQAANKKELPKYAYPDHVLMASDVGYMAKHGVRFAVKAQDCHFIRALDAQREHGKRMFGAGYLLSDRAAAERAAAERAAAERAAAERAAAERANAKVWPLSPREREIIQGLG